MITSYEKSKEKVLHFYEEFLDVVRQAGFSEKDTSLENLKSEAKKIKEDRFCLMIAGEAKSGKSTFINAYLGTEILPMDVLQCTSSVVEIKHGAKFVLDAVYEDGQIKKEFGEKNITAFLKKNAALDDDYRDIPITTINNEIILKYRDAKIPERVIVDLLKGVESENIHHLSLEEYNRKIRAYIKKKKPEWRNVVVKINIECPFVDENMRGVRIIDSPGVNAAGRVGEVTEKYIESADAIIFVRPITGAAIEANSFKAFLESKSVDRNKNAMFLVLTRAASESEETIERACEECVNVFGIQKNEKWHGIIKEQIIPVDSKAELYYNKFYSMSTEEIKAAIEQMRTEKKIEPFVRMAWLDAFGEKEAFLSELKHYSNFDMIDQSMNRFGRKAQYIALKTFLKRMQTVYSKVETSLREKIANYELKAEDPEKLSTKIKKIKAELYDIDNRMTEKVEAIVTKYGGSGTKGLIAQRAAEVMAEYKKKIEEIDENEESSFDELEKLSLRQVDIFLDFESDLQKKVVAECNEVLKVTLSDNIMVEYVSLEPDFSEETIKKIKEDMKREANETYRYTTGATFKKTHTESFFSQYRYYNLVKDRIIEQLENIKSQAIEDLCKFVSLIVLEYKKELRKNIDIKNDELKQVKEAKKTAEEMERIIIKLKEVLESLESKEMDVKKLKEGIDGNV